MCAVHIPKEFVSFLRESREGDAEILAPNLRAMDKKEIRIMSGLDPLQGLLRGFLQSAPALTLMHPKTKDILGMGGLSLPGNIVWLLLHKRLLAHKDLRSVFIRMSPKVCRWLLGQARGGYMGNVTLPENVTVLRWLRWMGAVTDVVKQGDPCNLIGRDVVTFMFHTC